MVQLLLHTPPLDSLHGSVSYVPILPSFQAPSSRKPSLLPKQYQPLFSVLSQHSWKCSLLTSRSILAARSQISPDLSGSLWHKPPTGYYRVSASKSGR